MHDEIGQGLTFLVLRLDGLGRQLGEQAQEPVAQTREVARALLDDVRRLSSQLRPGALTDLGLAAALRSLAQETRAASGLPIDIAIDDPGVLDADAQLVAYRVTQEALTNAVRHSRAALRGEPFLYPGAMATLIRDYLARGRPDEPPSLLTPREEEVLKLIAEGYSGKEIADLLVLCPKTVDRHRANLLDKLGMRDRLDLTKYAIRVGLIEP